MMLLLQGTPMVGLAPSASCSRTPRRVVALPSSLPKQAQQASIQSVFSIYDQCKQARAILPGSTQGMQHYHGRVSCYNAAIWVGIHSITVCCTLKLKCSPAMRAQSPARQRAYLSSCPRQPQGVTVQRASCLSVLLVDSVA